MERLTGLDASFLYLETPAQLMHVCGLLVLDTSTMPEGYSFSALRDAIEEATSDTAMFRRRLHRVPLDIDHPVWMEDPDFDIDRHVHRMGLPAPGGDSELAELCGHIAGIPLDRGRPLWEMTVIEGLAKDKIAVFTKMHHATVDGVSGANALSVLCSLDPAEPPMGAKEEMPPHRSLSDLELFGRGMVSNLTKPLHLARLVAPTVGAVASTVGRARHGNAMAAPLTAPRTSFNGTISGRRVIAVESMSLPKIKEIKNAVEGATVNDVVLTVCGGALRSYLQERGELPSSSLLATVPVSVRGSSKRDDGSNKVSALFTHLGTDLADPMKRLRQVSEANIVAKDHHGAIPADALQDWAQFAAPRTFGLAMRMTSSLRLAERGPVIHNLVISNVPGPPVALYFLGARIEALYPLGPIMHGAGLNITVMSSAEKMHIGLIACRELMPHADELAAQFPLALDELYAAAIGTPKKTPAKKTTAKKTSPKKSTAKKTATAKKSAGKKAAAAKKSPARKPSAKKSTTKKTAAR